MQRDSEHTARRGHDRKRDPAPRPWPGWHYLPFLLAAVPLVYLIAMVIRYRVDVLFWDDWALVPAVQRSYEGSFAWPQLWKWYGEHRLFFPRAIMLLLVRATGWNASYVLAATLLFACGAFAALLWQFEHTRKSLGDRGPNWSLPVLSVLVFSFAQWENWLWQWEVCFLLNLCAAVSGLVVLASAPLRWWRLPLALALGLIATYSMAAGLVYWPMGLAVLALRPGADRRGQRLQLAGWVLCAAVVYACYLRGFRPVPGRTPLGAFLTEPSAFLHYFLAYLGAPLSHGHAVRAGAVGLLTWLVLLFALLRRGRVKPELLAPYLALSGYAIIAAAITSMGRMNLGIEQALSSRYVTVSNLLWISDLALLYLLAKTGPPPGEKRSTWSLSAVAGVIGLVLLAGCALHRSLVGRSAFISFSHQLAIGRAALLSGQDDEALRTINENPKAAREAAEVLKRYHLSVYRQTRD